MFKKVEPRLIFLYIFGCIIDLLSDYYFNNAFNRAVKHSLDGFVKHSFILTDH